MKRELDKEIQRKVEIELETRLNKSKISQREYIPEK